MDNEKHLVAEAKRDREQFFTLYDHYYPKLYAYVLSRVRQKERAEDVVANTFVKAMDNMDQFTWRRSATFGSWLFRIAKNDMIDHIKKDARMMMVETEKLDQTMSSTPDAMESLIEQETEDEQHQQFERVLLSLQSLTELEQEVISLKYLADMSYKDISLITNKKPNTLAVTLKRALVKIRKDLDL